MGGTKPGKRKNAAIQMSATAGSVQKMTRSPVVDRTRGDAGLRRIEDQRQLNKSSDHEAPMMTQGLARRIDSERFRPREKSFECDFRLDSRERRAHTEGDPPTEAHGLTRVGSLEIDVFGFREGIWVTVRCRPHEHDSRSGGHFHTIQLG